jgi:hypothetical protein
MTPLALEPITAAGLLITDTCPARCRHCYVVAGPDRTGWMTAQAAAAHFAALARLGVRAEGIHVGGGEPFGDFERLLAIVRAARSAGLGGVGYVETNGGWATSEALARERLATLAEAGMRQLAISADPYHQEFVPPERVQLLHAVAREVLGRGGVRARRWKWLHEARDVAAMPETARLDLFRTFLQRYPERMAGRAAEQLSELVPRRPVEELPAEGCRRALLQSRHVHIDPGGWVYAGTCAGIVFGCATGDRPLDELLGRWRPEDSPLLALLAEGGPRRLLDAAARHGFTPAPGGYADKCHLCWSVRKHLVRAGAGDATLQPPEIYLS